MNLTPDVAESVKGNPDIKIVVGQSMDNMYIGLTTNPEFSEPLSKKEVRQAIRAAVDYDGILALTNNMAIRGPVVWPIGYLGLETQEVADQFNPQRDLARAKELLTQAGYPNGFSFKLEYGTGPSPVGITYESVAQKFQADLAEVGITVELVPEEFSVMLTNYRAKKAVAVISYNAPDYLGPSDMSGQMVLHTWAPRLYYDKTQSPQASELARKGDQATDPEERRKYYHELIRLLLDEGPYVNVVQGKAQIAMRQNIDGYRYFPIGYVRLLPITKG